MIAKAELEVIVLDKLLVISNSDPLQLVKPQPHMEDISTLWMSKGQSCFIVIVSRAWMLLSFRKSFIAHVYSRRKFALDDQSRLWLRIHAITWREPYCDLKSFGAWTTKIAKRTTSPSKISEITIDILKIPPKWFENEKYSELCAEITTVFLLPKRT